MEKGIIISASELGSWVWCNRYYYFRYIQKQPSLPTTDTIKGILLHKIYKDFFIGFKNVTDENYFENFLKKRIPEIVDSNKKAVKKLGLKRENLIKELGEDAKKLIFRVRYGFSRIPLCVEKTFKTDGLIARIDTLFEENDTLRPGDLKLNSKNDLGAKLQITTGAMILEKILGIKISKGTIISCRDWNEYDFEITEDLRQLVNELEEIIRNFKIQPYLPKVEYNPYKCEKCPFRHLCKVNNGDEDEG
jgi:radical SAM protein with 4Fe4S-binding SPASM domain